jgi:Ca2+-binding EF-hand superfamily protein
MTFGVSSDYSTSTLLTQLLQAANGQGTASKSGTATESEDSAGKGGMRNLFADIDSDGDGLVSAAEFTKFSDRFSTEASSTLLQAQSDNGGDASEKFASLDTNGDGSLDQSEFEAGMPPPPSPPPSGDAGDMAANLFASLDTDGDGSVSSDELQSALSQSDLGDDGNAASLLSELDSDGNGSISESELKTGLAALQPPPPPPPSSGNASGTSASGSTDETTATASAAATEEQSYDPLDTNQDGFVSLSERLAGMQSGLVSGALSAGTMAALLQSVSVV